MTKNEDFFENLSKKERATATTAAAATEEFSQSIQVPSSTHPGTTYPVRAIPHSDKIRYRICIGFVLIQFVRRFLSKWVGNCP